MFINNSKFKSYIKKAYKSTLGLGVERDGDDIVAVDAGYLYIEADLRESTKEFRAALIEICGRIPDRNEAVTFGEDGEQEATRGRYNRGLFVREPKQTDRIFEETPLRIEDRVLMQSSDSEIIMVKETAFNIFASSNVEEGEETPGSWKAVYPGMVAASTETMLMGLHIAAAEYVGEQAILDALISTKLNYSKFDGDRL